MPDDSSITLDDEYTVVYGVNAIAPVVKRSPRQTYYMLERGHIQAAFKVGDTWALRPIAWRRQMEEAERRAVGSAPDAA